MLPHLDQQALKYFESKLSLCYNYLEYGSGGSTVFASNFNVGSIISVDSDKTWVDKIDSFINKNNKFISVSYINIGPVRDWGIPIDSSGQRNYWKYLITPWEIADQNGVIPDLILIDGRFRVASFCYSWIKASNGATILIDDYTVRPEYKVIEKISNPILTVGRMAIFKKTTNNSNILIDLLLEYSTNHE